MKSYLPLIVTSFTVLLSCSNPVISSRTNESVRVVTDADSADSQQVFGNAAARSLEAWETVEANFDSPETLAAVTNDATGAVSDYRIFSGSHNFQITFRPYNSAAFYLLPEDERAVLVDRKNHYGIPNGNGGYTQVSLARYWPRTLANSGSNSGIIFEAVNTWIGESKPVNLKSIRVVSGTVKVSAYRTDAQRGISWNLSAENGPTTYRFTTTRARYLKDVRVTAVNQDGFFKVDNWTFEVPAPQ